MHVPTAIKFPAGLSIFGSAATLSGSLIWVDGGKSTPYAARGHPLAEVEVHGIAMPDAYTRIWKLCWRIAALSLMPLAIAVHVSTRTPADKPFRKLFTDRAPTSQLRPPEPWEAKSYTICGIAGAENCWVTPSR